MRQEQTKGKTAQQGCELSQNNPFTNPISFRWGKNVYTVNDAGQTLSDLFLIHGNYSGIKDSISRIVFQIATNPQIVGLNEVQNSLEDLHSLYHFISKLEIATEQRAITKKDEELINLSKND
jgi:hypothetical protein